MKTILKPSGEDSFWKDAIRDLVVVVVGILAALWLESWWQDQADRREERQILSGLHEEFTANALALESHIQIWIRVRQNTIAELEYLGGPVNVRTVAEFAEILGRPFSGGDAFFFDPRHGQLTSVISSGKLGLISNSDLRSLFADWPALVADHDFDENLFIDNLSDRAGPKRAEYGGSRNFEKDYAGLMRDRQYSAYVANGAGLISRMINEGEEILDATRTIVETIEAELGGD